MFDYSPSSDSLHELFWFFWSINIAGCETAFVINKAPYISPFGNKHHMLVRGFFWCGGV